MKSMRNKEHRPLGWCIDCDGTGEVHWNDHPECHPAYDESDNCPDCEGTGINGGDWEGSGLTFAGARYDAMKTGCEW